MELNLCSQDLKPEFRQLNTWETKYKHFLPDVQKAIKIVGRALYLSRDTHNAINPPNSK